MASLSLYLSLACITTDKRMLCLLGVDTGFGGSADTRPQDGSRLGRGLMQLLQSGVLTDDDLKLDISESAHGLSPHSMPSAWIRAATAVRINQCVRGHSAICRDTIKALLRLVAAGVTPVVPLRGSISASGDLMPLSYVAGALEGSPDIYVFLRSRRGDGVRPPTRIMLARDALYEIGMEPLRLGPREGLGLVNGTAVSAATASLAMFDAMQLTLIATGLTCLVSEAMAARVEWLHPFISETRPHPGQSEVAGIMREFLKGSLLIWESAQPGERCRLSVRADGGLAQDRYSLRTSTQWLGPQVEDLLSAYSQITIELNSTSDNPLTDPATGTIHHGGNFQATSITSAVEKIRSGLQMVGKLLFSQCTEMLNHQMSAGLPPSLAADDPSVSFCCKGLDISMAAYQSELSYLSNSMSNHVQSAEMHNQAVNSLAFLSTRYTMQAVEVLGLMVASALYAACQAMDLRVMHATFLEVVATMFSETGARFCLALPLPANGCKANCLQASPSAALRALQNAWWDSAACDASDRCSLASVAFVRALYDPFESGCDCRGFGPAKKEIREMQGAFQADMLRAYKAHTSAFMQKPTTADYVGTGSKGLYLWVRQDLGIPMHRGLDDHPMPSAVSPDLGGSVDKRTIGSYVSKIYEAVREGRLFERFVMVSKELALDG